MPCAIRSMLAALLFAALPGSPAAAQSPAELQRAIAVLATLDHAALHCPELVVDQALANTVLKAAGLDAAQLRESDAYATETLALNRSQETYDYRTHCENLLARHRTELPGLLERPEP